MSPTFPHLLLLFSPHCPGVMGSTRASWSGQELGSPGEDTVASGMGEGFPFPVPAPEWTRWRGGHYFPTLLLPLSQCPAEPSQPPCSLAGSGASLPPKQQGKQQGQAGKKVQERRAVPLSTKGKGMEIVTYFQDLKKSLMAPSARSACTSAGQGGPATPAALVAASTPPFEVCECWKLQGKGGRDQGGSRISKKS